MSLLTVNDQDGILVLDSRLIAAELDVDHSSFMKTLETYKTVIEQSFGIIRFEIEKTGTKGRPLKYALLTEDQAILATTFSRNTEQVVKCKVRVVEAFSKAKKIIPAQQHEIEKLRLELELAQAQSHAAIAQQKLLSSVQMLEAISPGLAPLALGRTDAVVERVEVMERHAVVDERGRTQAISEGKSKTALAKELGFKKPADFVAWLESLGRLDLLQDGVMVVHCEYAPRNSIPEIRKLWSQRQGTRQKLMGEAG